MVGNSKKTPGFPRSIRIQPRLSYLVDMASRWESRFEILSWRLSWASSSSLALSSSIMLSCNPPQPPSHNSLRTLVNKTETNKCVSLLWSNQWIAWKGASIDLFIKSSIWWETQKIVFFLCPIQKPFCPFLGPKHNFVNF